MKETRDFYNLDHEDIVSILSTEFYGSPWFSTCPNATLYNETKQDGDSFEDVLARMLQNGESITVTDLEEGELHELTLEKLKNGLEIIRDKYPNFYADYMEFNEDFYTMDSIIQCALLGDIIYG